MHTKCDKIRTLSRPSCMICGGRGTALYRDLIDTLFGIAGKWHMKQCENRACGLCWLDPGPVEADIALLYQSYYTHNSGRAEGLLVRLRPFFYACYLAASYPSSALLGLAHKRRQVERMFLDHLPGGGLLDVGCGDGEFLNRMRACGWSPAGVDFDADAIAHAKARYGLELFHGDLVSARFPENSFNAVTMNHVIEHLLDPVATLAEIKRVLKPGGYLVVTTPNIRSRGHRKFQECWIGLDPPRHLQIFTLEALRECARQAGWEVINVKSSAARADRFIGGSFGIRKAKKKGTLLPNPGVPALRALRSLSLQYREACRLRWDPDCGEEAVLIAEK